MKIAIMTNTFPSLSETFILDQITGLLDMGQEVVILAGERSNEFKVHADVNECRLLDRAYYVPNIPDTKILCLFKALILVIINLPKYVDKWVNVEDNRSKKTMI